MSLTNTTPAQKVGQEIDGKIVEVFGFVDSQLRNMHEKIINAGPQEVLDGMGANAHKALLFYAKFHEAIAAVAEHDDSLKPRSPAPNQDVFQVQSDGTVKFVPPPDPEPEPGPAN